MGPWIDLAWGTISAWQEFVSKRENNIEEGNSNRYECNYRFQELGCATLNTVQILLNEDKNARE